MWVGIEAARTGTHMGDIGAAIQNFVESNGYSVVREYGGHGIGRNFHEDPHVAHFGKKGTGAPIKTGMVFTIEPMVNAGKAGIVLLDDNWTVETDDRKLSAQFEHTVAITNNGLDVLTKIK
jgi:methionyl aminopeptidase